MQSAILGALPPKRVRQACCLLIFIIIPTFVHAQCPQEQAGSTFLEGATYYVDIDVRYRGTTIGTQIENAFGDWTYANTHNNNSNIRFQVFSSWSEVPPGANIVHVSQEAFTNQYGAPETEAVGAFQRVRTSGVYVLEATILFNTNAQADWPQTGPYFNPNAPGYSTIYRKATKHEVGHGMGLGHPLK